LPWDIEGKYCDVVVVCQVFEHLNPKQTEIFNEIVRISKQTIITIPWKWHQPGNIHHNINEEHVLKWFGEEHKPYFREIFARRLMLCYKF